MKKILTIFLFILIFSGLFLIHSISNEHEREVPLFATSNSSTEETWSNRINTGFNVKGSIAPKEQTSFLKTKLEELTKKNIKTDKIFLRLQGGSISQKTYPSDWTDEAINSWAYIQKTFGCKYIFVVNFNDTPENQMNFYNRLCANGIKFDIIELGNEQYLPKFSLSKINEFQEVTDKTSKMTPEKYVKQCNEYINIFKNLNLPFYIQFAPEKEDNTNSVAWNNYLSQSINNFTFSCENINGTIHLYERNGAGSLNVNQIKDIKETINHKINIAVTESGVIDKRNNLSDAEFIQQEKELTTRILSQLENGDILLNQVLYTDYDEIGPAVFHPKSNGITLKGESIFELFNDYWK